MITKIEQKKDELKGVEKEIKKLQKTRKALDSYIRLYEWRKKKEGDI
jgi:chromosome segregation ATPase